MPKILPRGFLAALIAILLMYSLVCASALPSGEITSYLADAEALAAPNALLVKFREQQGSVRLQSAFNEDIVGMTRIVAVGTGARLQAAGGAEPQSTAAWYRVSLREGAILSSVSRELLEREDVLSVTPDYVRELSVPTPIEAGDPFEAQQDYLGFIGAYDCYERIDGSKPGDGILIAILDTGIDASHPDLKGQIARGGRYFDGNSDEGNAEPDSYHDGNGHGTHVAGIIAAAKNGLGVTGVAYGAKLLPIKVLSDDGRGYDSAIVAGMIYAIDSGARILNLSFGGFGYSEVYDDAVAYAREHGVLIVTAAGNSSMPTSAISDSYYSALVSPANIPSALSVMSMRLIPHANGDYIADFSNWDSDPQSGVEYPIMAPGMDILSCYTGGRYAWVSGTSMSAPIVSGAAAIIMALNDDITPEEVRDMLVEGGRTFQGKTSASGDIFSYPALNIASALDKRGAAKPKLGIRLETKLEGNVRVEDRLISLSALDCSQYLVLNSDGSPASTVYAIVTNYSGAASDIQLLSGGAPICETIPSLLTGESMVVALKLPDYPGDASKVQLEVRAEYTAGDSRMHADWISSMDIMRPAIPEGLSWEPLTGYYIEPDTKITLNSDRLWCLPAPMRIGKGSELNLNAGAVLYLGERVKIELTGGSMTVNGRSTLPARLAGSSGVSIDGRRGTLTLNGCIISDPYIVGADKILDCYITASEYAEPAQEDIDAVLPPLESGKTENAAGDGDDDTGGAGSGTPGENGLNPQASAVYIVDATLIENTEIAEIWGLEINAREFRGNLVDSCAATRLTAELITGCTFRENLLICPLIYSEWSNLAMMVLTKDSDGAGRGFFSNCVIGPLRVCKTLDPTGVYPLSYANVTDVYYQAVGASLWGRIPTLADIDDKLYCGEGSTGVSESASEREAQLSTCPAFALSQTVLQTRYEPENSRVSTRFKLEFSRRIDPRSKVLCVSLGNPLYDKGVPIPEGVRWSDDGQACEVTVYAEVNYSLSPIYYLFGGFVPQGQPHMLLGLHSSFGTPITARFLEVLNLKAADNGDGVYLEWRAPQDVNYTHFAISRREEGGELTEIYSNRRERFAGTGIYYSFTDIQAKPGTRYSYQVECYILYEDVDIRLQTGVGTVDFMRNYDEPSIGFTREELSIRGEVEKIIGVEATGALVFDSLVFELVAEGGGFEITDVSNELTARYRIPVGVQLVGANRVRVTAGPGTSRNLITSGSLLANLTLLGSGTDSVGGVRIENVRLTLDGEITELEGISPRSVIKTLQRPRPEVVSVETDEHGTTRTLLRMKGGSEVTYVTRADGAYTSSTLYVSNPDEARHLIAVPLDGGSNATVAYSVLTGGNELLCPLSYYEAGWLYILVQGRTQTLHITERNVGFSDVDDTHWARESIAFTSARELFRGVSETEFDPGAPMTRAMLVTVLHRLEGTPAFDTGKSFADVAPGEWYYDAVIWAAQNEIVTGSGEGLFEPDGIITREALATIIYRYAERLGLDRTMRSDTSRFADSELISDWAGEAISWAVGADLMRGREGKMLSPGDGGTRAEIAAFLHRFLQEIF